MALLAYDRLRMLWGALDWEHGSDHPYGSAQTLSGGTSAAAGSGTGVRRVICVIDRSGQHAGADVAEMHFDFLNITGGSPDDTWTSGDYTTLEGHLDDFFDTIKVLWHPGFQLTDYNWYRVGDGITPPNPAERLNHKTSPIVGTGSTALMPPQAASTITFRTAVRRSWGRTYVPLGGAALTSSAVMLDSSVVDLLAGAADTLVNDAAGDDFALVVVSGALHAALAVESIEVDDNVDIVRRRRWKSSTYRKILP